MVISSNFITFLISHILLNQLMSHLISIGILIYTAGFKNAEGSTRAVGCVGSALTDLFRIGGNDRAAQGGCHLWVEYRRTSCVCRRFDRLKR
jgi:hypothetical protein